MQYRLGYYDLNGELECLRIIEGNKDEARRAYEMLKEKYQCTIWVQKIDFVNPKDEFKDMANTEKVWNTKLQTLQKMVNLLQTYKGQPGTEVFNKDMVKLDDVKTLMKILIDTQ